MRFTRVGSVAAATIALLGLIAGCSSDTADDSAPASTTTVTVSATSGGSPSAPVDVSTAAPRPTPTEAEATVQTRPASDFADGNGYGFSSPTGKIQCRAADDRLICQTPKQGHAVAATEVCGFYPGFEQPRATQFGYFSGGGRPCATIIQGNFFTTPRALNYGQSVVFSIANGRRITCSSATDGLTCRGSDGSGFFLSGESFRVL